MMITVRCRISRQHQSNATSYIRLPQRALTENLRDSTFAVVTIVSLVADEVK